MNIPDTNFKNDINTVISNLIKLLPKKKDVKLYFDDKKSVRHLSSIHSEAKGVFPACFSGARVGLQCEAFSTLKLVQNYKFGSTQKFENLAKLLHKEAPKINVTDGLVLDITRSAVATYTENVKNGQVRFVSKISDLTSSENEVIVERRNENYMSLTSFSINDGNFGSMAILSQYMHRVLPILCIGGEFELKPFCSRSCPRFSLSYRYDLPSLAVSGTVSQYGLQFCIFKELSEQLRVATIATQTSRGTVFSLALNRRGNDTDFKMFIDSLCCFGATLEKNLLFEEATATRTIKMKASSFIDQQGRLHLGLGLGLDF